MNMCVRPSSMIASTSWISEDWICLPHKHHLPISPQIGWGFTIPSPIHDGFLSSLILCRSCICSHSFFEFMCAIALQWPENNILLLKSAVFALAFFLLSQQCLGLGVFDFFVCWPALGLYNNHHWLQKEDFLMRTERSTYLWVQRTYVQFRPACSMNSHPDFPKWWVLTWKL